MTKLKSLYGYLMLEPDKLWEYVKMAPYRGSGPGGQKINTTKAAVRLIFPAYDISTSSQKYRIREENRISAFRLLRKEIALKARELPPTKAVESPRW